VSSTVVILFSIKRVCVLIEGARYTIIGIENNLQQ